MTNQLFIYIEMTALNFVCIVTPLQGVCIVSTYAFCTLHYISAACRCKYSCNYFPNIQKSVKKLSTNAISHALNRLVYIGRGIFLPLAKLHGQQMQTASGQKGGRGWGKKPVLPSVTEPYHIIIFGGRGWLSLCPHLVAIEFGGRGWGREPVLPTVMEPYLCIIFGGTG